MKEFKPHFSSYNIKLLTHITPLKPFEKHFVFYYYQSFPICVVSGFTGQPSRSHSKLVKFFFFFGSLFNSCIYFFTFIMFFSSSCVLVSLIQKAMTFRCFNSDFSCFILMLLRTVSKHLHKA